MENGASVEIEFTSEEAELLLMCLTLARNSPTMNGAGIDALIEKVSSRTDASVETGLEDPFETFGDEFVRDD